MTRSKVNLLAFWALFFPVMIGVAVGTMYDPLIGVGTGFLTLIILISIGEELAQ